MVGVCGGCDVGDCCASLYLCFRSVWAEGDVVQGGEVDDKIVFTDCEDFGPAIPARLSEKGNVMRDATFDLT